MPGFRARHAALAAGFYATAALILLPCSPRSFGEPVGPDGPRFVSRILGKEQGLPSNSVRAVIRTSDGYLWVATDSGLARFDGLRFAVFNRANTSVMRSDACRALAEGPDGTLWVGTEDGLIRMADAPEAVPTHLSAIESDDGTPDTRPARIDHLAIGSEGELWLVVNGSGFHGTPDRLRSLAVVRKLDGNSNDPRSAGLESLILGNGNEIWGVTAWGIGQLRKDGATIEVPWDANLNRIGPSGHGMVADPTGRHWGLIGSSRTEGALLTRWESGRWQPVSDRPVRNHSRHLFLVPDPDGSLWLPDEPHRLVRYRDDTWTPLPLPNAVASDYPTCLAIDRDGDLWVGTENAGLVHFRRNRMFTVDQASGLPDDNVRCLREARDGSLWLGTDSGLARLREGRIERPALGAGWTNRPIRALLEDREGRLWIGARSGLGVLTATGFQELSFPGAWFSAKIRSFAEDSQGRIWVAGAGGLFVLHGLHVETNYPLAALEAKDLTAMLVDRLGRIWLGTQGSGGWIFDGTQRRRVGVAEGLGSNDITALLEDQRGVVWIGTSAGLSAVQGDVVSTFGPRHGLPAIAANQILDDGLGQLWIGHEQGLFRVSRNELLAIAGGRSERVVPVVYDLEDGLPALETHGRLSHPAGCRTRDGALWIPTVGGVVRIDPTSLPDPPTRPAPVLEEIRANGRARFSTMPLAEEQGYGDLGYDVLGQSSLAGGLSFSPGTARNLEFRWTAPTFRGASQLRFAYRLEGLDTGWIDAGVRRHAFYANLDPGRYRFHLRARDKYGRESDLAPPLAMRLEPRLHENRWFLWACAALALGCIGSLYAWREKHLRRIRRLEADAEALRERERLARDLHDGMSAHLTQITVLAAGPIPSVAATPEEHRAKLLRATREAAQSLKDLIWSTRPEHDDLGSLVTRIEMYAGDLLETAGILLRCEIPDEVPSYPLPFASRTAVFLVVKEALHNAVRHARATTVLLRCEVESSEFRLRIEDDGDGFDPRSVRPGDSSGPEGAGGLGLTSMRQRIESIGGVFRLDSSFGAGTRIWITVPFENPSPR